MHRRSRMQPKRIAILGSILVGIPLILSVLWAPQRSVGIPYPANNGYEDFLRAVPLVSKSIPELHSTNITEWQSFITSNRVAMTHVRAGLGKSCLSSNRYDFKTTDLISMIGAFKYIGHTFRAEAIVALHEDRTNDAVAATMEGMRFANESSRGGVIIEASLVMAVEKIVLERFTPTIADLDQGNTAFALSNLLELDESAPAIEGFFEREEQVRHQFADRWQYLLYRVGVGRKTIRDNEDRFRKAFQQSVVKRKKVVIRLAKRMHELTHGKPAASWSDVVPEFVPAPLIDPSTERPVRFTP